MDNEQTIEESRKAVEITLESYKHYLSSSDNTIYTSRIIFRSRYCKTQNVLETAPVRDEEQIYAQKQLEQMMDSYPKYIRSLSVDNILAISDNDSEMVEFELEATYTKDYYICLFALQNQKLKSKELNANLDVVYVFDVDMHNLDLMYFIYYCAYSRPSKLRYPSKRMTHFIETMIDHPEIIRMYQFSDAIRYEDFFYGRAIDDPRCANGTAYREQIQEKANTVYKQLFQFMHMKYYSTNSSEYRIYSNIKIMFDDAIYQYRCNWLSRLSLDIYIPSINTAIEYQGAQHTKAVDYFGGEEGLAEVKRRDAIKRQLCIDNGINLLEYSYKIPTDFKSVLTYLINNGIDIININQYTPFSELTLECNSALDLCYGTDTNRVTSNKDRRKKISDWRKQESLHQVIRQYSLDGLYLAEYDTIQIACEATNVELRKIRRCLSGEKNSGGGFIWRKCDSSNAKDNLDSMQNNCEVKDAPQKVVQINECGELTNIFDSIKLAYEETGISIASICAVIDGKQKTAGGYFWKYIDS